MTDCQFCAVDLHGHGDGSCDCDECRDYFTRDLAANDQADAAINTVALQIIADLAENVDDEWGNYPEISEHDWRAVQDRVLYIAGELRPEEGAYLDAYGLLEQRAF
jgi:hypothetical protein